MAAKSTFSTPKTPAYTAVEETTPGEVAAKPSVPLPHSKYQGKASIGEGVHVKGDVHDCSQVDVHGLMEGEIEADILIIHEKGRVKGVVKAGRGEIHGEVDGDVTISGRLEIRATGLVSGAVNYGELSVEAGGRITGQLEQRPDKSTEAQTPMSLDKSRVSNEVDK